MSAEEEQTIADEICPHCLNPRWKAFDGVWEENCQCHWDELAREDALISADNEAWYEREELNALCEAGMS